LTSVLPNRIEPSSLSIWDSNRPVSLALRLPLWAGHTGGGDAVCGVLIFHLYSV